MCETAFPIDRYITAALNKLHQTNNRPVILPLVHILNGDALAEFFPKEVSGDRVICRECLIDGPVDSADFATFFAHRAHFIQQEFGDTEQGYHKKVVSEFNTLKTLPCNTEVTLWFEDDLFCQVNFWFSVHFLLSHHPEISLFLARPDIHTQYGFAALSQEELIAAFHNRIRLDEAHKIADVWKMYQKNDLVGLEKSVSNLAERFPFIAGAVHAHIQRIPTETNLGRPKQSLRTIIKELGTTEFGPVFREFCKREYIYGFGDTQVKKLWDELMREK